MQGGLIPAQALVWVEACAHLGLCAMWAFHRAWLPEASSFCFWILLNLWGVPMCSRGMARHSFSGGLLLGLALCILLRVAKLNPQNMIWEGVDWFFHVQREDELNNQAQVQLLDFLLNEAQLGELWDHEVHWGILSPEFFMDSGGLGNDITLQLPHAKCF